jgi:glycine/D-amino acid oxidase-like deaminating enzyme
MAKLRLGTTYWLDRFTGGAPRYPTLAGRHHVDVAIVGGGITGCLAAHAFVTAGFRVLVLEGNRIGTGSTAASTALLMQEPDVDFRDLAERYGTRRSRTIWKRSASSVQGLVALIRRLRIDAALQMVPSVYFTSDRAMARDLRRELQRRHRAGIGGRWLSSAALELETGIDGAGAILTMGNAQVDPLRACLGLAKNAQTLGATICERSPARRVKGTAHGVHIELDRGEVRADWAVIATGYATAEFKPLAGRFRMSNTYVIATAPIDRATERRMGLHRVLLWDTETPYHYARWTPDRRLLFGGRDQPRMPRGARPHALSRQSALLKRDLAALYPALHQVSIDYSWEGLFATTADGLPFVGSHRRYPRHLFALGYGGNGMTFAYLAAQLLLRVIKGQPADADVFFGFSRMR